MKYIIIIIALLLVTSTTVLGYLIIKQNKPITTISSPSQSSDELIALKSQITKLQNELTELKNTFSKQLLLIQKLKDDYSATTSPTLDSSEQKQPVYGELFKDPDFVKEFQERVDKAVNRIQQKQGTEISKRVMAVGKDIFNEYVNEFSKSMNLNAYQQQEFSKILEDRVNKSMTLIFLQFGPQKLPPEEFKSRQEVIRNESNEKVKQILLPEQYEQYQKTESQFSMPMQGLFEGGQFGKQQPQQQEQTPQIPK